MSKKAKKVNVTEKIKEFTPEELAESFYQLKAPLIPEDVLELPVYMESRFLFVLVLTESISEIYGDSNAPQIDMGTDPQEKLREMIKQAVTDMTIDEVMANSVCYSEYKAEKIRKEVVEMADQLNLLKYLPNLPERRVS